MSGKKVGKFIIWLVFLLGLFSYSNVYAADGDAWIQVAPQYLTETNIWCMTVYNNKIYGGTTLLCELLEWNGVNAWVKAADSYGVRDIFDIIEYDGALVACNLYDDLVEWDDVDTFVKLDDLGNRPWNMAELNGNLYICNMATGILWEWDGLNVVQVAPQFGSERVGDLAVLDGVLYGVGFEDGLLLAWNGINAWTQAAAQYNSSNSYRCIAYNGTIYAGTTSDGISTPVAALLEWNGVDAWTLAAGQAGGDQTTIFSMVVYDEDLYVGTFPDGELYRWDGVDTLDLVAGQLNGQTYIRSLVVHNELLYGGTGVLGRLFQWNGRIGGGSQVISVK